MIMSFNRGRAQLRCEEYLKCTGHLEKWNQSDFENFALNKAEANQLTQDLSEDSVDLYFKGLLSLSEALNSVSKFYYSWATIKLYYSVYYFIKATLASKGIALIRRKALYYLFARDGQKPVKKSPKKYNSDHSGTLHHYQDLFPGDILLSNNIDDETVYEWLMKRREQIQYRERNFHEPSQPYFWNYIVKKIEEIGMNTLIDQYIRDKYLLCFQEEHACMATPIKRAILTKTDLVNAGIIANLSDGQRTKIVDLLIHDGIPLPIIHILGI